MARPVRNVAIIGAGPAGSALASYLCRSGVRVALFGRSTRPPLVVGESLVPATVPFLRELGIEDEVRSYSTFKPGATFVFNSGEALNLPFAEVRGARTRYSYNVPRDRLDETLARVAARSGARVIDVPARLERVGDGDRVQLSLESLASTDGFLREQPDWIVDASGRVRELPRLLGIPHEAGDRRDTALFAHCDGVAQVSEGNVHTDFLERGWSWRIPLPGRMSVGLVIDSEHIKTFGDTLEEQFDNYLKHDPLIERWGSPKRLTQVMKYSNYQLVSRRGVGDGWALVGDTFGFVDPVFSSGLLLAFDSARELAGAIVSGAGKARMRRYESHVYRHIRSWQRIIDHFYSGRLFTLFRVGDAMRNRLLGRLMDPHFSRHLPRVFTGEATTKRYSVGLTDFMCRYALLDNDPAELRIR